MKYHLDKFNIIIIDIKNFDSKVLDEDQAMIFPSSLPNSYAHFVGTLTFGRESILVKEAKATLNIEELKKKGELMESGNREGLNFWGKTDNRDNKPRM